MGAGCITLLESSVGLYTRQSLQPTVLLYNPAITHTIVRTNTALGVHLKAY